jgi:hypothetical protein
MQSTVIVETIQSNYPGYITYPSYRLRIGEWIIFEITDKQVELRITYDKAFKEVLVKNKSTSVN